jgi:GNAT superfamily N-acetyltransferase
LSDDSTEWRRGDFVISTDRARLDLDFIHAFLNETYWAANIPRALMERSFQHSMPFGLYQRLEGATERQVGFARVITDYATFGYVADVLVDEAYRGRGLAVWLMDTILAHPDLQGFRNWMLMTRDAQGVYEKSGFVVTTRPLNTMERRGINSYPAPTPSPEEKP